MRGAGDAATKPPSSSSLAETWDSKVKFKREILYKSVKSDEVVPDE